MVDMYVSQHVDCDGKQSQRAAQCDYLAALTIIIDANFLTPTVGRSSTSLFLTMIIVGVGVAGDNVLFLSVRFCLSKKQRPTTDKQSVRHACPPAGS